MKKKASIRLADGRELIYFGESADWAAGYPDLRPLGPVEECVTAAIIDLRII